MSGHKILQHDEMMIIRLALADRVERLDTLIKEFPDSTDPAMVLIRTTRDDAQALREKLLPALIYTDV